MPPHYQKDVAAPKRNKRKRQRAKAGEKHPFELPYITSDFARLGNPKCKWCHRWESDPVHDYEGEQELLV